MLRTSSLTLKFANTGKKNILLSVMAEYIRVVNAYIDRIWDDKQHHELFISKEIQNSTETWFSERLKQCVGNQALHIIKSQNKKKKKTKPVFESEVMELDQRFISFCGASEGFDEWIKFWCIGNNTILFCPLKFHRHYNRYIETGWIRKKSIRLRKHNDNLYIDVFFEKAFVPNGKTKSLGIDMGMNKLICTSDGEKIGVDFNKLLNKISRKKHDSKAWHKAIIEKNEYIDVSVKKLPLSEIGYLYMEDLTGINKRTMKKTRKQFRDRRMKWSYRHLSKRVRLSSEVVGVQCQIDDPSYTSQTCNICGDVHKGNREGEMFLCVNCGHAEDADINASRNILDAGVARQNMVAGRMKVG